MVSFHANGNFFMYSSGVFSGCGMFDYLNINHVMLLVGYNDKERYWLVKNSYGPRWGDNGFIKISYDRDCGVSTVLTNFRFTTRNANPQIDIVTKKTWTQNDPIPKNDTTPGNDTQPPKNDTIPPKNDTQPPKNDTIPPKNDTIPTNDT